MSSLLNKITIDSIYEFTYKLMSLKVRPTLTVKTIW